MEDEENRRFSSTPIVVDAIGGAGSHQFCHDVRQSKLYAKKPRLWNQVLIAIGLLTSSCIEGRLECILSLSICLIRISR